MIREKCFIVVRLYVLNGKESKMENTLGEVVCYSNGKEKNVIEFTVI